MRFTPGYKAFQKVQWPFQDIFICNLPNGRLARHVAFQKSGFDSGDEERETSRELGWWNDYFKLMITITGSV